MRRMAWFVGAAVAAVPLVGCVERRYVVTSDPPGAVVLRNNQHIGPTPADDYFTYYGNYHFTLIKDGYAPLQVNQDIRSPWFEYFPLDFFAENILPWRIEDVRRFHYKLEPIRMPNPDEVINEGQSLRNRGKAIGAPAAPPAPAGNPG